MAKKILTIDEALEGIREFQARLQEQLAWHFLCSAWMREKLILERKNLIVNIGKEI